MQFQYRIEFSADDSQVEPKTVVSNLNDIQSSNPKLAQEIVAHYSQNATLTFATRDDEGPISVTRLRMDN